MPESHLSPVRLETTTPTIDMDKARKGAEMMLSGLGMDLSSDSTRDTPNRMVDSLKELTSPEPFTLTTFDNDEGYNEMLIQQGIPFVALCEHHGLPFTGRAAVGYLPHKRLVGLSKISRVVRNLARQMTVQERLTKDIAETLTAALDCHGVGVSMKAEHLCMTIRGVQAHDTITTTSSMTRLFRDDERTRAEFFSALGR